jgi:hypothetical protein
MPERAFAPTPVAERDTWRRMIQTFRAGLRVIRARPPLRRILAVGVFYGLYSEAWDRLWQVHLISSVGLPTLGTLPAVVWLSAIMVAEMLVGIAAGEALRRRLDLTDGAAMARAASPVPSTGRGRTCTSTRACAPPCCRCRARSTPSARSQAARPWGPSARAACLWPSWPAPLILSPALWLLGRSERRAAGPLPTPPGPR